MNEYFIIFDILEDVFNSKNLTEVFNFYVEGVDQDKPINRARIKDISYGVLRYYFIMTAILNKLCKVYPQNSNQIILLIGIYELLYTKKSHFAVVNDLVNFSYLKTKNQNHNKFINGVLRNFLRNKENVLQSLELNQEVKYNFPLWIVNKIRQDYKNNWQEILKVSNQKPTIGLRLYKINMHEYTKLLDEQSIAYVIYEDTIVLKNSLPVINLPLFSQGYVSIQDAHAQQLKKLLPIKAGQSVLDACSAPGGKTCQILENNNVSLTALDIDSSRLEKVQQNLKRLGLIADLVCADAGSWSSSRQFDVIVADVPCSATGTIKHNPDIKLHRRAEDIKNFVDTQRKIILNLWGLLKPGGKLAYITCSIFREENQDNIDYFSKMLPHFSIETQVQLLPNDYADGFFYCIVEKKL